VDCLKCEFLISKMDDAGGGIYQCKKYPGIVLGEWGHWTDEEDNTPKKICE
jgi:hypothetical protein